MQKRAALIAGVAGRDGSYLAEYARDMWRACT